MTASLAETTHVEEFRAQELQEHARVLYVALTRAVESLFLTWTGRAQTNSWGEMCRLELSPGVHRTENYSYEVHEGPWEPEHVETNEEKAMVPRAKYRELVLGSLGPQSLNVNSEEAKPFSVTEMLERKPGVVLAAESDRDVVRILKSAATGTAVHKLMELLKYPSRDLMNRLVSKWFPGDEERVLASVDYVRHCKSPPLAEIIVNGEVEWGFAVLVEGLLIEGQIDLWGRTNAGQVWIVDYKTGTPEYKEKAFEQMSLYALALRGSGLVSKDETIKMAAVYPFAKDVFIEKELSREATLAKFGLKAKS